MEGITLTGFLTGMATLLQTVLAIKNELNTSNDDLEGILLTTLEQGGNINKKVDKLQMDVFRFCKTEEEVLSNLNYMKQLISYDTKVLNSFLVILEKNLEVSQNLNLETEKTNDKVKKILEILHKKFEIQKSVDEISNNVDVLVRRDKSIANEIYLNLERKNSILKQQFESLCQDIIRFGAYNYNGNSHEIPLEFFNAFPLEKALIYYPYLEYDTSSTYIDTLTLEETGRKFYIEQLIFTINNIKIKLKEMVEDSPPASILRDKIREIMARPLFTFSIDKNLFSSFPNCENAERIAKQLGFLIKSVQGDIDSLQTMLFILKKKNQASDVIG